MYTLKKCINFTKLFTSDRPVCPSEIDDLIHTSGTERKNQLLTTMPDLEEIRRALFSMGNYKSPGPDGITVIFYKTYWNTVGQTVIAEIQYFFAIGMINQGHNHMFIVLISKIQGTAKVEQFRLIALCNVFFKIATKILMGRIRQILLDIIHPN